MFDNCPPPNLTKAQYCISEKRPRMYCILLNSVIFFFFAFINYVGIEEGGQVGQMSIFALFCKMVHRGERGSKRSKYQKTVHVV